MHLVTTYALQAGAKIKKPKLKWKYYPLPFDKYVTLHLSSGMDSKNYDFWPAIIRNIAPVLQAKGYHLVQIGGPDDIAIHGVSNLYRLCGKTDNLQSFYLLKNAALHISNDTFSTHVAGIFEVPIVGLYSVSHPSVCGPYWAGEATLLESERAGKKPSYSPQETPKMVNKIKMEEIVNAIYKHLAIEDRWTWETAFFGNKFELSEKIQMNNLFIEVIPTDTPFSDHYETNNPPTIRDDLATEENVDVAMENIWKQLDLMQAVILTERPLSQAVISHPHLIKTVFKINEKNYQNIEVNYFKQLKDRGVPYSLIYDMALGDKINDFKFKLLDVCELNPFTTKSDESRDFLGIVGGEKLKFISGKYIYIGNDFYSCYANVLKGKKSTRHFEVEDCEFVVEVYSADEEALNQLNFSYFFFDKSEDDFHNTVCETNKDSLTV